MGCVTHVATSWVAKSLLVVKSPILGGNFGLYFSDPFSNIGHTHTHTPRTTTPG